MRDRGRKTPGILYFKKSVTIEFSLVLGFWSMLIDRLPLQIRQNRLPLLQ